MNVTQYRISDLRMHYFPCMCVLIFLLIASTICSAQIKLSDFNDYTHYTVEDGLPSTFISGITEDKHGFLWIATSNGISRYDGTHFTNFTTYLEDSIQYEIGFISSMIVDESGENIWIGTKRGILRTSVDTFNFKKIEHLVPLINYSLKESNDLLLDDKEILWSAKIRDGLSRIDLKKKVHEKFPVFDDSQKDKFLVNSIRCIIKDPNDNNILWFGTLSGLVRFNKLSKEYQVFVYENKQEIAQNKIRRMHVTNEEVFLGTWGAGLLIFDKQSKQFSQPLIEQYPNSHLLILDIYGNNESNIWVTTADGLIQYDLLLKRVNNVTSHEREKGILKGISFIDSRGIIWFCSQKGLFKFDPLHSQNMFIQLEKRSGVQNPMLVKEIILTEDFYYVLGFASSGLYKINRSDYSFEIIKIPYFDYDKNNLYRLRDMVEMDNGNFLIVSGNKITIFDPKTQQFKLPLLQVDHPHPVMQSVIKDKKNNYWIGSKEGGLFCLNFETNTLKTYKEEFSVFRIRNHIWINRLYLDSENKLWIAKGSSSVMDLDNLSIHCLNPTDSLFFYQDVGGFQEDSKGRIWTAGYENGIGFTNFDNFQKGVSHKIDGYFSGVYPYNDSLLWTTGKSLGTINTNTMSYKEIKLSSNNKRLKVEGPVIPTGNGKFIIGCDNGVLIYNPEEQLINNEIPTPYIRKIVSDGKKCYEGNSLTTKDFNFKSGIKHLVFKISSLGFHFSDQITYQYKFESEWQNIGASDEINLTNLSHGDHILKIRACNNLGICNEIPKEYNIIIPTPWWASWWAYIIYLGIAILFADRFYRFQLSKRLAVAESARLKEVNQLRNSLYANITHEFRTPLTVILGMVDAATSNIKDKQLKGAEKALEMIKRNGTSLLRLVNEMLDLSKLESGSMDLQLIQTDVIPFVKYISESFNSLADEKQIGLTVYSEIDEVLMDFDANKLSVIISNVLSNAIKFTQPEGKIIVHLNRISKHNHDFFFIKIKDNGQGIPEEEIQHIFNRFYQIDNSSSRRGEGTGIGLALTKEFVELMDGAIEVKSTSENGSEFTIQIPISNIATQIKDVQIPLSSNLYASASGKEFLHPDSDDKSELPHALIIEDNADVAHYLETCLTGKYQTLHAANGEIGIEMAFDKVPDIIITDVMMPVKDGLEVCSTLKTDERTDHIPIIMLTAKVTMKDRLAGLSYGADAYLTKPFVKAELLTRLDQLVLLRKKIMQKIDNDSFSQLLRTRAENPETKFLQKIIKIIHEEISNHSFGSSVHLSRMMQLSESQIYRKLKAITGKSTAVFIRSVRLQKAKEMIQTTDKTISEVAYDVGFNDPSWFSRAFKEEFGYAPSAISKP